MIQGSGRLSRRLLVQVKWQQRPLEQRNGRGWNARWQFQTVSSIEMHEVRNFWKAEIRPIWVNRPVNLEKRLSLTEHSLTPQGAAHPALRGWFRAWACCCRPSRSELGTQHRSRTRSPEPTAGSHPSTRRSESRLITNAHCAHVDKESKRKAKMVLPLTPLFLKPVKSKPSNSSWLGDLLMPGEGLENLPTRVTSRERAWPCRSRHKGRKQARQRVSETSPGPCPVGQLRPGPTANSTPHQAHTRPPRWEGRTAVRTEDDSGLDTLWLLKKMDSRSERVNTGRSQLGT